MDIQTINLVLDYLIFVLMLFFPPLLVSYYLYFPVSLLSHGGRSFRLFILTAVLSASLYLIVLDQWELFYVHFRGIGGTALACLVLKVIRCQRYRLSSVLTASVFLASDLAFCACLLIFIPGFFSNLNFNYHFYFFFPLCFYTVSIYVLANFSILDPGKTRLTYWKIIAYAFPESRKQRRPDVSLVSSTLAYILPWTFSFFLVLLGYYLGGFVIFTWCYLTFWLAMGILFRKKLVSTPKEEATPLLYITIITGLGASIIQFFDLICGGEMYFSERQVTQLMRGFVIVMPAVVFTLLQPENIAKLIAGAWSRTTNKFPGLNLVLKMSRVSLDCLFKKNDLVLKQAGLISFLFVLYFLVPRSGYFFRLAGIEAIASYPVDELLMNFRKISESWTLPFGNDDATLVGFLLGNQGVVLLLLLWPVLILTEFNYAHRIEKIPNSIIKDARAMSSLVYYFFFNLPMVPITFFSAFAVPFIGIWLLGQSIAIILGAFALSMIVPMLISFNNALGFFVLFLFQFNMNEDAMNINTAPRKELLLLPGIGPKIANRIVNKRPFADISQLTFIRGIDMEKYTRIKDLIRVK